MLACEFADSLIRPMQELVLTDIGKAKCHIKALAYMSSTIAGDTTASMTNHRRPLLQRLDEFDVGDNPLLFDTNPKMEFIPCKPTFFDIALNYVGEIPDLKASLDSANQSSKGGGIFSWLRRGYS